ncbi:MAG: hypothetical protein FWG65_11655 [Turicibacter sp.]|nr:hypothetical protein [Turicibacter sp.]
MRRLKNNQTGSAAVETLIAFVCFLMFTAIIVTFVNVAALQLRVHYALTQTAMELSYYSYVLRVLGVVDLLNAVEAEGSLARDEIDGNIDNVFNFLDAAGSFTNVNSVESLNTAANNTAESGQVLLDGVSESIDNVSENPGDFFASFLWMAAGEGIGIGLAYLVGDVIAPSFFWRYMGIRGGPNGRTYFNNMPAFANTVDFVWWDFSWGGLQDGIAGGAVRPEGAAFLSSIHGSPSNDEIVLGVRYNLDLTQFIILPDNLPTLTVFQHVKTRAFVGDGGRFEGER